MSDNAFCLGLVFCATLVALVCIGVHYAKFYCKYKLLQEGKDPEPLITRYEA